MSVPGGSCNVAVRSNGGGYEVNLISTYVGWLTVADIIPGPLISSDIYEGDYNKCGK